MHRGRVVLSQVIGVNPAASYCSSWSKRSRYICCNTTLVRLDMVKNAELQLHGNPPGVHPPLAYAFFILRCCLAPSHPSPGQGWRASSLLSAHAVAAAWTACRCFALKCGITCSPKEANGVEAPHDAPPVPMAQSGVS